MKAGNYAVALFAAVLIEATPALATDLPAAAPPPVSGIQILSARYGDPASGQMCDAAAPIAAICQQHRECTFEVRNVALCGDPSFLVVKQLNVTYTCGLGEYRTRISEYGQAELACRQ